MKHIDIKDLFANTENYMDQTVTVCGWVRTTRDSKNISFVELNDGTTIRNIQVVIEADKIPQKATAIFKIGSSVKIEGKLVESGGNNGCEVLLESYEILGDSPADYPLQKKGHSAEFLRTIPHLRVRTRLFEATFTVRDRLAFAIHQYFHSRGYKYIHAPIITGSDAEGAGEMFRVTTHPWKTDHKTEEEYYQDDFFGKKAGLSVSCQLEGEMAAMGLGRIYTFGPTFRAEHSNTVRHVAEFWHVEPEIAFADIDDLVEIAEDFIKTVLRDVLADCAEEIAFFDRFIEKGLLDKLTRIADENTPFAKVSYTEAIEILQNCGKQFEFPVEWGSDLQTEHEKYLTEEHFKKPTFVMHYPAAIKSFYMKQNPDGKTVAATDLLVPGIGEIIGGSEREADYDKLVTIMKKKNMPLEPYREYLDTRKYGSVPHSGFGLGFDRLLMYITGTQNIRDTLLFPRTVGNL